MRNARLCPLPTALAVARACCAGGGDDGTGSPDRVFQRLEVPFADPP